MSNQRGYERPDAAVLTKLESLVGHLTEELAQWHRRALKAEAELKTRGGKGKAPGPDLPEARKRVVDLEVENQALRQRIDFAKDRVHSLAARMAFLERSSEDGAA